MKDKCFYCSHMDTVWHAILKTCIPVSRSLLSMQNISQIPFWNVIRRKDKCFYCSHMDMSCHIVCLCLDQLSMKNVNQIPFWKWIGIFTQKEKEKNLNSRSAFHNMWVISIYCIYGLSRRFMVVKSSIVL